VVTGLDLSPREIAVQLGDGARHLHSATETGWHIELLAAGARSSIDLGGVREPSHDDHDGVAYREHWPAEMELPRIAAPVGWLSDHPSPGSGWMRTELGEAHYVRSEQSWREAGSPAATVILGWDGEALELEVDVRTAEPPKFEMGGSENPYDNEPAEVNGHGVQVYVSAEHRLGAWIIVPQESGMVHVRAVSGWEGLSLDRARWRRTAHGYTIRARVPISRDGRNETVHAGVDVIVNETSPERKRRRGQLVLGGGGGFVYLRGDRHPTGRLVPLVLRG
jgi:hypothetical protein